MWALDLPQLQQYSTWIFKVICTNMNLPINSLFKMQHVFLKESFIFLLRMSPKTASLKEAEHRDSTITEKGFFQDCDCLIYDLKPR